MRQDQRLAVNPKPAPLHGDPADRHGFAGANLVRVEPAPVGDPAPDCARLMLAQRERPSVHIERHAGEFEERAVISRRGDRVHHLVVGAFQPHPALGIAPCPIREFLADADDLFRDFLGQFLVEHRLAVRPAKGNPGAGVVESVAQQLVEGDCAVAPQRRGLGLAL